jgi:hypothetical protein
MSELPNIQENNEQILNDIQSLQQMEQQLFNSLETNPNLTSQQQEQIVEKINGISNMRINLYKTLSGVNNYYGNALNSSIGTLKEQTAAIAIVENELNVAKKRLEVLEAEKNNKIRLVEINDYYGDKYAEHASLMKIIIFTLIPVIILAFLNNNNILPNTFYYILVGIIAIIGSLYFWYRYASIIARDNMNYQEYDWYFNPSAAPKGSADSTDPWATTEFPGTCIGELCCSDGQTWNTDLNQCIGASTVSLTTTSPSSSSSSTTSVSATTANTTPATTSNTETFVNNVLTKTSGNLKQNVNLKPPMPNNT